MSNQSAWQARFSRRAERDLDRLDPPIRERMLDAVDGLLVDHPTGDIKRLTGIKPPEWRLRVGDWRIRFQREEAARIVEVQRVLPRGRAYRG
ncbi:MAG: type II toxin-antitoxin system RelE family toxin [Solirubrobacteraceae bacterium]